jgi:hypothetical protein
VNGPLAKVCETFATAVVLHDDVIPRITPDSIRDLLRDLLQVGAKTGLIVRRKPTGCRVGAVG